MKETRITRRLRMIAIAGAAMVAVPLAAGSFQSGDFAIAQITPVKQVEPSAPVTLPSGAVSYAPIVAANKPAVVTILARGAEPEQRQGMSRRDFERHFGGENTPFGEFFRRFFESPEGPFANPDGPRGFPGPQGRPERPSGLGSGFIISADGMIVTNNHVVERSSELTVVLDDGTELPAKLVGSDPKTDLAVIKVTTEKELPFVLWGESDSMKVGDPVLAIGNPFGIGTTVTAGIVSARGRDLRNGPYDDFIQVDAPINRGNSGGPLISMEGKVVGVNAAIYSPNGGNVGVGFAIPSKQAQSIVSQLVENGSIARGFIGVSIQPVTADVAEAVGLPKPEGAIIAQVTEDAAAAKAGLQSGDIVTAFGGKPIDSPKTLARTVADVKPGTATTVTVWRQGKETKLDITVGTMNEETRTAAAEPAPSGNSSAASDMLPGLGVEVTAISPDTRQQLDLPDDATGVVISSIENDGSGAAGLTEGDIVLSINQEPVKSVADARNIVSQARQSGKKSVLMLVQRGEARTFVAVPFAAS